MKARAVKSENPVPYLAAAASSAADDAVIARALEILAARHAPGKQLGSPADTEAYLRLTLAEREREYFAVLFLDNQHRVIALEELFSGTIDCASVHPREVVKSALRHNAAAVILTHNHPSGSAEPSLADQHITGRLRESLGTVDIRVLDHVVVASQGSVSLAERGMI